jgi:hypothetical protein
MNSSTIFRTENGSCYLYDANHQQLLNLHPIIETIHDFYCQANVENIRELLIRKYPELSIYAKILCSLFYMFYSNKLFR